MPELQLGDADCLQVGEALAKKRDDGGHRDHTRFPSSVAVPVNALSFLTGQKCCTLSRRASARPCPSDSSTAASSMLLSVRPYWMATKRASAVCRCVRSA